MRKLTNDEALKKLNKNNSNVLLVSQYYSSREKCEFKCLVCNNQWNANAKGVINGTNGCPICGKKKAKETIKHNITTDDFRNKIKKHFGEKLTVIGEYIDSEHGIEIKCNTCGFTWISKPKYLIKEYGCRKCGHSEKGKKLRKKHDVFINQINIIYDGRILILGEYNRGIDRISAKCLKCGHEWMPITRRLLNRGCPKCNLSKGEIKISQILKELNINFEDQYIFEGLKTDNNGVPIFDFVIFNNKKNIECIIEYDGEQHFKEVKKWGGINRLKRQQEIDQFKNKYCYDNNIKIIRIPYTDFKKINKDYILKLL